MTIVLYDLATRSGETISPNPMKTKLCLILKQIPFETKSVPLHEVQKILPLEGIPPASKKADGTPFYSIPAIHDLSTGVKLSDSWEIALYLDKTYPETPRLFPEGTIALQRGLYDTFRPQFNGSYAFFLPRLPDLYIPETGPYISKVIERIAGKQVKDVEPHGKEADAVWAQYKEGLAKIDEWYSLSGGKFLTGDVPVWADLPIISFMMVHRNVWGKDSQRWKDVCSWHGGRWADLVKYFDDLTIRSG